MIGGKILQAWFMSMMLAELDGGKIEKYKRGGKIQV